MSESVVQVDLRQATLSESARLREGETPFLALDTPPPVRSLLRLVEGETVRAFEVGRVIEVVDEQESERGCYGSFIEIERLEEMQGKVGSEHLSPGISNSGVPAPVVIMNTSDMMLGEVSEQAEAQAAADADAQAADADAASSEGENAEAEAEAGDAATDGEGDGGEAAAEQAKTDGDSDGGEATAEQAKTDGDAADESSSDESSEGEGD